MTTQAVHKKKSLSPWGDDHPEKSADTGSSTIGWNQQLKGLVNPASLLEQVFGSNSTETPHGPKHEHQIQKTEHLVFSRAKQEQDMGLSQETNAVLHELKKQVTLLEKQGKGMVAELSKIKVDQMPAKKGIYYLRYLEWLIQIVKQLRIKIEDGSAWIATFNQRGKKKQGYWNKYKKHGTSFGLSNERSLATQTG